MAATQEQPRDGTAYEPFRHHGNDSEAQLRPLHSPPSGTSPTPAVIELRPSRTGRDRLTTMRTVLRVLSAAISLAIVGVVAATIVRFEKTKNMRMLWPHGLALPAWTDEAEMNPTYL